LKTVILAGGFGTRLSEYTENIPKPMVNIGNRPMIWHIMNLYSNYGFKDFVLALGYKSDFIKDYFTNIHKKLSNFSIDLSNGELEVIDGPTLDWKISLIDTGLNSNTGGRIKRLEKYISNSTFMVTYGDGLSNINLQKLLEFHKNHGKIATITAVRPSARFGELSINNNKVTSFKEKPQVEQGWINGGFMVFEPKIFEYLKGDESILEREPLENLSKDNELMSFKHEGFWQCMDTKRDKDYLDSLSQNNPPWK
jgi:glucose-1-phosphate cytidylyltransferase